MSGSYLGHGGVVQVAQFGVTIALGVSDILSEDDILHLQHAGTLQHLHLGMAATGSDVGKQGKTGAVDRTG